MFFSKNDKYVSVGVLMKIGESVAEIFLKYTTSLIIVSCREKKSVFKGPIDTIYLSSELTSLFMFMRMTAMHRR